MGKVLVFPWSAWAGGARVMPATSSVRAAALRPFSGSSFTCDVPITCDSVPVVTSTWAVSAVTVTVSVALPGLSVMLAVTAASARTCTPFSVYVSNPAWLADML